MLDPIEVGKIQEARVLLGRFLELGDCCKHSQSWLVEQSLHCAHALDRHFVWFKPKTQSIIHPLLAANIIREVKYFIRVIERIRSDMLNDKIAALAARTRVRS